MMSTHGCGGRKKGKIWVFFHAIPQKPTDGTQYNDAVCYGCAVVIRRGRLTNLKKHLLNECAATDHQRRKEIQRYLEDSQGLPPEFVTEWTRQDRAGQAISLEQQQRDAIIDLSPQIANHPPKTSISFSINPSLSITPPGLLDLQLSSFDSLYSPAFQSDSPAPSPSLTLTPSPPLSNESIHFQFAVPQLGPLVQRYMNLYEDVICRLYPSSEIFHTGNPTLQDYVHLDVNDTFDVLLEEPRIPVSPFDIMITSKTAMLLEDNPVLSPWYRLNYGTCWPSDPQRNTATHYYVTIRGIANTGKKKIERGWVERIHATPMGGEWVKVVVYKYGVPFTGYIHSRFVRPECLIL